MNPPRPCVLIILDGWGIGPANSGNAVHLARTPCLDRLRHSYPGTRLLCSGEAVGLPSPSNCLFILVMCYFYVNYRAGNLDGIPVVETLAWSVSRPPQGLAIMTATSLLMMSTFMFYKVRGKAMVVTAVVIALLFSGMILTFNGVDVKFIPQLLAWVFIWGYVVLNIIIDVSDTSKYGFMKRNKERRAEKRAHKDEKRKLKEDMKRLRKEKAELQEETRALRRMKDRLLGRRRRKNGKEPEGEDDLVGEDGEEDIR